eukprot:g11688.t1
MGEDLPGSCVGETRRASPLLLIELGCGHAGLSAYLAALRCGPVIATDLPEFLYRADATAEANEAFYREEQEKPRSLNFRTAPLPFGDRDALERILRDLEMVGGENRKVVMVGAGVTYWEYCTPEVYIAYFRRNWGGCEKRLWTKLMPKRFFVDVVAEELADERALAKDGIFTDPRVFAPYCMRDAEQCLDWNLRLYRIRPKELQEQPLAGPWSRELLTDRCEPGLVQNADLQVGTQVSYETSAPSKRAPKEQTPKEQREHLVTDLLRHRPAARDYVHRPAPTIGFAVTGRKQAPLEVGDRHDERASSVPQRGQWGSTNSRGRAAGAAEVRLPREEVTRVLATAAVEAEMEQRDVKALTRFHSQLVRRALQVVFMLLVLSLGLDPSSWGFFGWLGRSAEKKAAIAFSRRGRRTAAGGTMDEREQQEDNEGETGRTGGWAAGDDEGETAFSALLQVVLEHYVVPATLRCYSFAYYHYQNSTAVLYLAVLLSGAVAGIGLLAFLFSAWQLFCIFALGRTRPTERKIDPQAARKSSFYDSTQKFASSPADGMLSEVKGLSLGIMVTPRLGNKGNRRGGNKQAARAAAADRLQTASSRRVEAMQESSKKGGSYGFEAWQPDENSHSTPADGVRGVGRGDPVSSGVGEAGGGRKKSKTRSSNIKTKEKAKKRGAGGECEAEVAAGAAGKSSSPGKSGGPRDVGGDEQRQSLSTISR